jgi:hypothetical protein
MVPRERPSTPVSQRRGRRCRRPRAAPRRAWRRDRAVRAWAPARAVASSAVLSSTSSRGAASSSASRRNQLRRGACSSAEAGARAGRASAGRHLRFVQGVATDAPACLEPGSGGVRLTLPRRAFHRAGLTGYLACAQRLMRSRDRMMSRRGRFGSCGRRNTPWTWPSGRGSRDPPSRCCSEGSGSGLPVPGNGRGESASSHSWWWRWR